MDPWGLADVNVINEKDPAYAGIKAINPPDKFTFAGHGIENNPNKFVTVGDEGEQLGLIPEDVKVEEMGDKIIAKWDEKKDLYDLSCYGHSSGADAKLAKYISSKKGGRTITIYGADGKVLVREHAYTSILGDFGPAEANPQPSGSGWQPTIRSSTVIKWDQ